ARSAAAQVTTVPRSLFGGSTLGAGCIAVLPSRTPSRQLPYIVMQSGYRLSLPGEYSSFLLKARSRIRRLHIRDRPAPARPGAQGPERPRGALGDVVSGVQ